MQYDQAGNLKNDGNQSFDYDATGQQTYASGTNLNQNYDGDGLRTMKTESGVTTYYLRSSVLGGQVVAELNSSGALARGYVYLGGQMVAIQLNEIGIGARGFAGDAGGRGGVVGGLIVPGPGKLKVAAKGAKFFRGFANRQTLKLCKLCLTPSQSKPKG